MVMSVMVEVAWLKSLWIDQKIEVKQQCRGFICFLWTEWRLAASVGLEKRANDGEQIGSGIDWLITMEGHKLCSDWCGYFGVCSVAYGNGSVMRWLGFGWQCLGGQMVVNIDRNDEEWQQLGNRVQCLWRWLRVFWFFIFFIWWN